MPDPGELQREMDEGLASSTIPEYFARMNQDRIHGQNHVLIFDRAIRTADEAFGSPIALTHWYDRNVRMVHHCWRALEKGDKRLLLVVGAGHVRVLEHLFGEAPMFETTSQRPYLPDLPA